MFLASASGSDHVGATMRAYRVLFGIAAVCSAALGTSAALSPVQLVGAWSVAAFLTFAAWRPERAALPVAIALSYKVVLPLLWLLGVWRNEAVLPRTYFFFVLVDDLIWWFPLLSYLVRGMHAGRTIIAWTVVVIHVGACGVLLAVRGGTETVADAAERAAWVAQSVPAWTTAWVVWVLASLSLLAFFVAWSARLLELAAPRALVVGACLVCATGVLFDLSGESVNIVGLTEPGLSPADFEHRANLYVLLSPGVANGLYCVAGLLLSAVSWRTGFQRGGLGLLAFCMWSVGLALTATAFLGQRTGMIATGAAVMGLFLPWAALTVGQLRGREAPAPRELG